MALIDSNSTFIREAIHGAELVTFDTCIGIGKDLAAAAESPAHRAAIAAYAATLKQIRDVRAQMTGKDNG